MESLFGRYKNALVLMLVLLAQVVLLAMQVRRPAPDMPDGHNVRLWRYLVTTVITPPERLVHSIGKSVRGVWSNYIDLRNLREQNVSLQQENDRLRIEQASLAEDAREGERLREMLDFRGRYIDKTVTAQVIGTSGTDQARVIYIDKGSKDGLQVQMPVITPDGIVGKLKNVFPHTSQVLLVSDQTNGTGVLLETTRVRGVMKGNASGQPQMINISPDERIKPGEPVITSGGDQVYPPGMPVGTVDRVVADPDSSYVNVVIKPNANLAALEEVLVVSEFSDKIPFAQAKDMIQSEVVALAAKQRAADVLSEKLPSVHDPNAPETAPKTTDDASAASTSADPARPMRPPPPIHPDRYSPGAAPPADSLTPGVGPPVTYRSPSAVANAPVETPGSKSASSGTVSVNTGSDSTPMSRFPAKPGATVTKPAAAAAIGGTQTQIPTTQLPTAQTSTKQIPTTTKQIPTTTAAGVSGQTPRPAPSAQTGQVQTGQSQPAQSPTGQSQTGTVVRKSQPVDSDAGGILTPAGMGPIGTAPRPRPTTPVGAVGPAGGTGAATTSSGGSATQTTPTAKPTAPKQQAPKPPAAGSPASPGPAGQSSPPKQPPATVPPGGG